jgi:RNA polymerase sigma-70 factor (ECF subfamily)
LTGDTGDHVTGESVLQSDDSEQELLAQARAGDASAAVRLFDRRREALRRAIQLRLDRRLAARVDVSDVLQDTYLEAVRRLPECLTHKDMPFDLWLHWLAREQVLMCHRRHLGADKRAVGREVGPLPADSSATFVGGLLGKGASPSKHVAAAELAERLRLALGQLDDEERDLILWKHFEQLSNREVAQLLQITEAAASKRYIRALERLRGRLLNLGVSGAE